MSAHSVRNCCGERCGCSWRVFRRSTHTHSRRLTLCVYCLCVYAFFWYDRRSVTGWASWPILFPVRTMTSRTDDPLSGCDGSRTRTTTNRAFGETTGPKKGPEVRPTVHDWRLSGNDDQHDKRSRTIRQIVAEREAERSTRADFGTAENT